MELIYTNQLENFDPDKRYRVPSLFRSVERDVTAVVIVGDYPEIVAAYEAANVEVSVVEAPGPAAFTLQAPVPGELTEKLAKLLAENEEINLLIDGMGAGEIHRPGSGDLALRLFEVLGTIHASVVELTAERDGLRTTVDSLRDEVEALKAAANQSAGDATEIEALKAKLDEAKVSYRANASKESLEKLVAELPKA
jgi:hypothetical protein